MRVSAVVLAAGKSSRMGKNKLLLEIDGKKILDWLLSTLTSTLKEVIVVTGYDPEPIRKIAKNYHCKVVHNTCYEKGMTTSFQTGLKETKADAVFLVLGDSFGLDPELLKKMIEVLEKDNDTLIVSPIHNGKNGHPVLFHNKICKEILNQKEDIVLRDIMLHHSETHKKVEGSVWTSIDFDTPQDFEKVKNLGENYRTQTAA